MNEADNRACTTCGTLIDLNGPHTIIIDRGGRRPITVKDARTGLVHCLTTKQATARRLAKSAVEGEQ